MSAPEPVWIGRVAIYQLEDGSAVVNYRAEKEEKGAQQKIPAGLWEVVGAAFRGERIDISFARLAKLAMGR